MNPALENSPVYKLQYYGHVLAALFCTDEKHPNDLSFLPFLLKVFEARPEAAITRVHLRKLISRFGASAGIALRPEIEDVLKPTMDYIARNFVGASSREKDALWMQVAIQALNVALRHLHLDDEDEPDNHPYRIAVISLSDQLAEEFVYPALEAAVNSLGFFAELGALIWVGRSGEATIGKTLGLNTPDHMVAPLTAQCQRAMNTLQEAIHETCEQLQIESLDLLARNFSKDVMP